MQARLLICGECGKAGSDRTGKLTETVTSAIIRAGLEDRIAVTKTGCMNVCDNPVTIALQGEDRATCIFAGVDAAEDIESIIATCRLYLDSPRGWIEDARGCGDLRFKLVARVPALT